MTDTYFLRKNNTLRKIFLTSIGRIKISLVICQPLSVCKISQRRFFSCCDVSSLALASALKSSRYLRIPDRRYRILLYKAHWQRNYEQLFMLLKWQQKMSDVEKILSILLLLNSGQSMFFSLLFFLLILSCNVLLLFKIMAELSSDLH